MIEKLCANCRFDVTYVDLSKQDNKCPRCRCGIINKTETSTLINQPSASSNNPLVPGKPLTTT